MEAYTMVLDLSGFTPLTESLMREGNKGAEQLSIILNKVFDPLVDLVYSRGGFIPYFAGDAFTAIFPSVGTEIHAKDIVQASLHAHQLFREGLFSFGQFTFGLKVGLSFGTVHWGIVGDNKQAFYFRGKPIDQCAQCQVRANDQDIVIDEIMKVQLDGNGYELHEMEPGFYKLGRNIPLEFFSQSSIELPPMNEVMAAKFLPEEVINYDQDGEFRRVIAVFISFDGIDSHDLMNRFATQVLDQVHNFSGYFKEIDFGDKGGVMFCFFGAPVSFENNTDRALQFINALRDEVAELQVGTQLQFKAALSLGLAYTGIVGGKKRCQYAAVGNRVNLAARLMTYADWGEILVDEEIRKNPHFKFFHKGDIKYKGIKGNIPTFKLIDREFDLSPDYESHLVARQSEVEQLMDFSKPLQAGKAAGVTHVYGEAGIGKSRLTYEVGNELEERFNIKWFICQSDQILRKPFNPFIYFLKNYFRQLQNSTSAINQESFESVFAELIANLNVIPDARAKVVKEELERTRTVLAAHLGILYPDSLWDYLDAKGRYENTLTAIISIFEAEALFRPIVIEIEDGHWMDDSSMELLHELIRRIGHRPIWVLTTSRYLDDGTKPHLMDEQLLKELNLPFMEIDLKFLQDDAIRQFAESSLGSEISEEFFELLKRTTNGNPFYLEQMLKYFAESNLLNKKEGIWNIKDQNVKLSHSINAVLTARIDRLSKLVRETVKAAAVIGREFEMPVLSEVMRVQEGFADFDGNSSALLREQVKTAEQGQIWLATNELRYIFRHSLLREAVYSMQLRTRLQQLHQLIAEAIERIYADTIEARYVDLAFHYEQAGVFDKTCEYLRKAADYSRRNYQNQRALEYYDQLLNKLGSKNEGVDEIKTHLKKGKVLELIGEWDECQKAYEKALELAKKSRDVLLIGQTNNNLAHLLMLKGDYPKAMNYLQTAAGLFESVDDRVGIARVNADLGNLYFRQGKYEEAKRYFEQSIKKGLTKRGTSGSAQIASNLGLTHMNLGNYQEAIEVQEAQLRISKRLSDKQGMASLYTNLGIVYLEKGDHKEALECFEQGLALSQELGNRHLTAIAIGSMGTVYEHQGDYEKAMECFLEDLEIVEDLGDKQGTAIALGLIGELHNIQGEFHKAIEYLQKNLMLCEELGYQKGIAKAVNTLGDVFYFTRQYERSIHYYERSIQIARTIKNRLVLGSSLVELGAVYAATGDLETLEVITKEALGIAEELGNTDLLFEAKVLNAQCHSLQGEIEDAQRLLNEAIFSTEEKDLLANGYFQQWRIAPEDTKAYNKALALYEELYQRTPKYIFRERINQLRDAKY